MRPGEVIMKKSFLCALILLSFVVVTATRGNTQFKPEAIDIVKPTDKDIPEGFMYGTVPEPYRKTLKNNPWTMDRAAIKRLADKIYPGGDYNKIVGMHVSIITKKEKPFGDDIVCYVIVYSSMKAAHDELKKLSEYSGYNRDRVILLSKDNIAVLLFVDDVDNLHFIQEMGKIVEERMKTL
jgi:hypothetical protein